MLLSAALIVKNEARFLPACLSSIRELVDETVVVDTGSEDGSAELARQCGARVFDFPWCADFSAARNFGLEQVRGDWVLYIDADERIRPADFSALRRDLSAPSAIASHVLLHPRAGATPFWILRLFRSHPLVRFRGVIHENIWPGVLEYRAAFGGLIARSGLVLDHEGYTGDIGWKHERNLPLLLRELEQAPGHIYCWCHLADTYAAAGREEEAVQAWNTAISLVRRGAAVLPDGALPYVGLIQFEMSRKRGAAPLIEEARTRFPHNLQLVWLQARSYVLAARYHEAKDLFEWLAARGETGDFERAFSYDARLLNAWPYEGLAVCNFRLGNYAESRRYYALASRFDPARTEYRIKQALCSRLEQRAGAGAGS